MRCRPGAFFWSQTMTTAVAQPDLGKLEAAVIKGDLTALSEEERLSYYRKVCQSLGPSPNTQPFGYISLGGRQVLYAKRDATDQLRKLHKVSITDLAVENTDGLYVVTATAKTEDGRTDASKGAVYIAALKGDALA